MNETKMKETIAEAVRILRSGGILLYPTDTVWGIGCDASNEEAVAKVFAVKKRQDSKSLILLADSLDMVCRYVREIPEIAVSLVEVNDKPMTIIYPDAVVAPGYGLARNCVAEDGSVGIRIPMSDFCRQLVARFGKPVVSTSANISGDPAPKSFEDISQEVIDASDYIIDPSFAEGATGTASSVIKVGPGGEIKIIRP